MLSDTFCTAWDAFEPAALKSQPAPETAVERPCINSAELKRELCNGGAEEPIPPIRMPPLRPPLPPNFAFMRAAASSRSLVCLATYSASDSPGNASTPCASVEVGIGTLVPVACVSVLSIFCVCPKKRIAVVLYCVV